MSRGTRRFLCAENGGGDRAELGEYRLKGENPDRVLDTREDPLDHARDEEDDGCDPDDDPQDVEQGEELFAFPPSCRTLALKRRCRLIQHCLCMLCTAGGAQLCAPVDLIEETAAIVGTLRAQFRFAKEEREREVEQKEQEYGCGRRDAERQESRTGEQHQGKGDQWRWDGAQVEVTQGLTARQQIVEKLALAYVALTHGNDGGRTAVGRLLQRLVAAEGETVGEQALQIAKDGAPDAARPHAGNGEGKCREGRRECRTGDDPRRRGNEGNARRGREESREEGGECRRRCGDGEQPKEHCGHHASPPSVTT